VIVGETTVADWLGVKIQAATTVGVAPPVGDGIEDGAFVGTAIGGA
jgi:hypothetical protein